MRTQQRFKKLEQALTAGFKNSGVDNIVIFILKDQYLMNFIFNNKKYHTYFNIHDEENFDITLSKVAQSMIDFINNLNQGKSLVTYNEKDDDDINTSDKNDDNDSNDINTSNENNININNDENDNFLDSSITFNN